ncbi:sulfatase-like hydrolase/transferase [Nonomuraea jiangxiensis]|uniref:Arylsulfatase A n=1 Tax=Nonomuraea jiangxiensis TaxID=633440 RepID=A0A1G7Z868_9ACTN|nr:sulfatase-like hydrolase/transferase [Nonomuraea jiangxiensis]SDH04952.1 Arylsulfatase A [Nonomuraea jiangxiensis]
MRPNVIVVFTDQQRWDTVGPLTPNLDRMARHGTQATVAITPQPVCAPARAALQTGRYPTTTGVHRNGRALPAGERTLAHHFGAAGYATGYIGKWHLADTEPVPAEQRGGYRSWLGANALEHTSDAYRTIVYDEANDPVLLPGYRSDALLDAAVRFVADHHEEPFYLFVSLLEPHHQNEVDNYPAPDGYEERYQGSWMPPDLAALGGTAHQHMGGYLGQIKRLDEGLGRLLDALRSLDLLDDTIVAYTSDHGNHFKTRNGEYKRSCHDASLRVPLALRGPGFDGGGAISRPVSTIDLPPTLLAAAGLPVPEEMQGRSFLPLVRDSRADWPEEVFFQVSESEVGRGIRTSRWKYYAVAEDAHPWDDPAALRYREQALYDLESDPYELANLAGFRSHAGVAAELRERLVRRIVAAGEAEPVIDPAVERSSRAQAMADPAVRSRATKPVRFGHQPPRDR